MRVQAGVVKDQLNAALKSAGLFFAPELSTSNRATVGGMINTDASGQGSCTYGKTRDHVLELDMILRGGERLHGQPLEERELQALCAREDRVGEVYRCARQIIDEQGELIEARFPDLNRCLTGYDLAHLREADNRFNLNSVLCGAEGSLGFVVEAQVERAADSQAHDAGEHPLRRLHGRAARCAGVDGAQAAVDRNRRLESAVAGDAGHRLARRRRIFPGKAPSGRRWASTWWSSAATMPKICSAGSRRSSST